MPYNLLVDEGHAIAEKYEVWKAKQLYGVNYMGVERSTFIIDEEGRIARIFRKVKVDGHVAEVSQAVAEVG